MKGCKDNKKNKKSMLNEILMPTGKMKDLNVAAGASAPTVRKALRGKSMSLLCMRIREEALKLGGVEVHSQNKRSVRLKE